MEVLTTNDRKILDELSGMLPKLRDILHTAQQEPNEKLSFAIAEFPPSINESKGERWNVEVCQYSTLRNRGKHYIYIGGNPDGITENEANYVADKIKQLLKTL
jgi:hypothetical protein